MNLQTSGESERTVFECEGMKRLNILATKFSKVLNTHLKFAKQFSV